MSHLSSAPWQDKMVHLSAGRGLFIVYHIMSAVKMSHLSSAPCQDGASFGRSWSVHCSPVLFSYHECCQDVPSFVSTLPRWHIFQQVMFHLCFALASVPVGSLWSPWRQQEANLLRPNPNVTEYELPAGPIATLCFAYHHYCKVHSCMSWLY